MSAETASPHRVAVEFVGGPVDGLAGFVAVGIVRLVMARGGEVHLYEFDPKTTPEGLWVFRHRGLVVRHLRGSAEQKEVEP